MHGSDFLKEEVADDATQRVIRMLVVESEQKYKTLVENALVGIFILNHNKIIYGNPYLEQLIGYKLEEVQTMDVTGLIEPSYLEIVTERMRARQRGESKPMEYELKLVHKKGHTVDVRIKTVPCMYEQSPATLGTVTDITEKNRAEARVRELRDIVENVPSAVLCVDSWKIVGKPAEQVCSDENPDNFIESMLSRTRDQGRWNGVVLIAGEKSSAVAAQALAIPVVDKDDIFVGATVFLTC